MRHEVPWPRVLVEGVVIVVSVLVALAADAWWDGRRDRVEETARLTAVRDELVEAQLTYEGLLTVIEQRTLLTAEVIQQSQDLTYAAARLDSIFFQLGPFADPSPPTQAYSDAVSGGGLSLITSAEVRRALGRYGTAVEAVRTEAQALRESFEADRPILYRFINLQRQMVRATTATFRRLDIPDVPFSPRYGELLADQQFMNGMVYQVALMERIRIRTDAALLVIDELLELLESLGYDGRS